MCVHGEVGVQASRYNAIYEADIGESGMDYVALGHVHAFSGARTGGARALRLAGLPGGARLRRVRGQGRDHGRRGRAERRRSRFVPTCLRRYEALSFDLGAGAAVALPADAERNCYKITLTGEAEAAAGPGRAAGAELEGHCFGLRLRDETRLRRDVWARAGEDTLRGTFLRHAARSGYDAAEDEDAQRELVDRAARWGLAALEQAGGG